MKRKFRKPLAAVLSFSLLMGCFAGLPSVANATDGEATPLVEESNVFTFADFENGTSPFTWNGSRNANNTGHYFSYKNGNKSLFMNDVWSEDLKNYVSEGILTGKTMTTDTTGLSYVVGNDGYRPVKVSFQFKVISKSQGNGNFYIYPLTFKTRSSKVPMADYLAMQIGVTGSINQSKWWLQWTDTKLVNATTDGPDVFKEITDASVNKSQIVFADASKVLDLTETHDKDANAQIIDNATWYNAEINYAWNDEINKVTITAVFGNDTEQRNNSYTVSYDPELIKDYYNFGFILNGNATPVFVDNFAYFSENMTTHRVVGPHTAFMNTHKDVITAADGFDLTNDYVSKTAEEKNALKDVINTFLTDYEAQSDLIKNFADVLTAYNNVVAMKEAILSYSASTILDDYIGQYGDVLGIVNDDLTVDPADLATEGLIERTASAVAAFNEIDEESKSSAEGVVISTKLNRLNQCLRYQSIAAGDGIYTQNFESTNDFESYAEYEGYKENLIGTVNDFPKNGVIATDTNNSTVYGIQTVVPNNFNDTTKTKNMYGQFTTVDKALYDIMKNNGKYLSSGSFDMYLLPFYNATNEQMIIYGFKDTSNYRFFGMFGQKSSSAPSAISVSMRDYEVTNSNSACPGIIYGDASEEIEKSDGTTQKLQRRAFGFHSADDVTKKWYHCDFMYDSEGKFHLVVTDENGRIWSYDSERTISVPLDERILAFGMMGQDNKYYVDNVTLKFTVNGEDSEIDERAAFCSKQSIRETTELVTEKIVPYDFTRINQFISDFNALSETNKSILSGISGCISRFQAQMALWNTASDSKIAESFVTIYADKLAEPATLSVFNRLTVSQRDLIKKNYAESYNTMIQAAKDSTVDDIIDITCVGDSITAGSGAYKIDENGEFILDDKGNKILDAASFYPAQLAAKLGEGYQTYNHGVAGIKVLQSNSASDTASTDGQFRGTEQNYIGYYSSVATNPDIVIIMLGTNDNVVDSKTLVCSPEKRAQIKAGYTDLVQSYLALDCNPTVILATIPVNNYPETDNKYAPAAAKRPILNEIYEEVAAEYGLSVIDIGAFTAQWTAEERNTYFHTDNLHPSIAGYDQLSNYFADYIKAGKRISNTASACMYDFTSMEYKTIQPEITDSIALTYKATIGSALIKSAPEIAPKMTFELNGKVSEPVAGTLVEGTTDTYTFAYPNIMVHNMADKITATLTVGAASETYEYSVMDYCKKVLDMSTIDGYTSEQLTALKKTIVDLVSYGAAVQKYRNAGMSDDSLMTSMLTSDQLNLGTTTDGDLDSLSGVVTEKLSGTADDDYQWTGVTLVLKDKTNIRCRFTAADVTNLKVNIKVDDMILATQDINDFTEISSGVYSLDFDNVYAYEYGKKFSFEFCIGETQVGQTLNYSVNTYLKAKKDSTVTNLVPLLKKINNFGNASVEFQSLSASSVTE